MDIVIFLRESAGITWLTSEEIDSYQNEPIVIDWKSSVPPRTGDFIDIDLLKTLIKGKLGALTDGPKQKFEPETRVFPQILSLKLATGLVKSLTWELSHEGEPVPCIELELC